MSGKRIGGRYIRDPETGERVRLEPDQPGRLNAWAKPAADALDPGSRDAAPPHTVRDDGSAHGKAAANTEPLGAGNAEPGSNPKGKPSRKKSPARKAPQGQAAAGADAPPRLEGSAKRGAPVKTNERF